METAMRRLICLARVLMICATASACSGKPQAPDVHRLASDVHVEIAGQAITLPWIALADYAYTTPSFSLNRSDDRQQESEQRESFRAATSNAITAPSLDSLNLTVRTYGWNDSDMRQRAMCPLLTKQWSRSVCDNPWAAIQQALPVNRFTLVDLSTLKPAERQANCTEASEKLISSIKRSSTASLLCEYDINGSRDLRYYTAIVQISDNLGAVWPVAESAQSKETASEKAIREGRAIIALVRYGLGKKENFSKLHEIACQLRRPESADGPGGSDCLTGEIKS
jgi:hypothetical protein